MVNVTTGALATAGAALFAVILQLSTGAPLRAAHAGVDALGRAPGWVWQEVTTTVAVVLIVLIVAAVIRRRRVPRNARLNVRRFPSIGFWGELNGMHLQYGARWAFHLPIARSTFTRRPVDQDEIAGLIVELPPRCAIDGCGTELAERAVGVLRRSYRWRCVQHGVDVPSDRPWVLVADDVRRVLRAELERHPPGAGRS